MAVPFYSFTPILHHSPSPSLSNLYSTLSLSLSLSLTPFSLAAHRIAVSERRLHLQPTGDHKVGDHPDDLRSNLWEWRTVLVARKLVQWKVDITELRTRFSEQSQQEVRVGYIFFWSDRSKADRRDAVVAFVIRNDIVRPLPCLPQGTNNRPMSLRLPLQGGKFVIIVSVYAPPMNSSEEAKNKFCEDLHAEGG
ncbi:hypothetical protein SprV_0100217700 [Sparganum proliferum]